MPSNIKNRRNVLGSLIVITSALNFIHNTVEFLMWGGGGNSTIAL